MGAYYFTNTISNFNHSRTHRETLARDLTLYIIIADSILNIFIVLEKDV